MSTKNMTQQEVEKRDRRTAAKRTKLRAGYRQDNPVGPRKEPGLALLPRGPRRVESIGEIRARKEREFLQRQPKQRKPRKKAKDSPTSAQQPKPRTRAGRATRVREAR